MPLDLLQKKCYRKGLVKKGPIHTCLLKSNRFLKEHCSLLAFWIHCVPGKLDSSGCTMACRNLSSLTRDGNCAPLQKCRVLITGAPGKSPCATEIWYLVDLAVLCPRGKNNNVLSILHCLSVHLSLKWAPNCHI